MKKRWDLGTLRGAIFDMDGTLLDSMFFWNEAGPRVLREVYGKTAREDLMDRLKPLTLEAGGALMCREYGLNATGADVAREMNALVLRFYREQVQVKPGALQLLQWLRGHDVPMAVATSTDRPLVQAALERTGLSLFFDAIFTCTEVGYGKERPAVYDAALTKLDTPRQDTWVFEDALFAVRTAKAAGYPVAAVADASQKAEEPALRNLADRYLNGFSDLAAELV